MPYFSPTFLNAARARSRSSLSWAAESCVRILACPFGTINYNPDTGKVAKCDLCSGDPQCADACPTGAITYVDAGWTGYDRMQEWAVRTHAQTQA